MTGQLIRHDRAWRGYVDGQTVVTTCDACPGEFAVLSLSQTAARDAGERHLVQVHEIAAGTAGEARRRAAARAAG